MCNDITLKDSSHEKTLGGTTNNKLSFEEHGNNICKTANIRFNALSTTNHYMKQNQKEILLSFFMIFYFSYCPFIWMFCSKKFTKKINAFHERPLRIALNDYESTYALLLEGAHQMKFYRRCLSSLMIKVYKYLNGHSHEILNDVFKLTERRFH